MKRPVFVFWLIVTVLPIAGIIWSLLYPEGFLSSRELW